MIKTTYLFIVFVEGNSYLLVVSNYFPTESCDNHFYHVTFLPWFTHFQIGVLPIIVQEDAVITENIY